MIIHSLSHEMDTTVDVPMASLTGHYMLDAKSLRSDNFDSLPQSKWSDNLIENNGMSITFKEVFQNFRESAKSADLSKIRTRPQSKQERIVDAFNRTEHLLSAGNLRPKSKYRINDNVHTEDVSSAVLHSHISEDNIRKIFSVNTDHEIVAAERRISPEKENLVENDTNNASEKSVIVNNLDIPLSKKGKKYRKRTKSESKSKKFKPGKLSVTLTGTHHGLNKRTSTSHSTVNKSSTATSKPRVSSEPLHSKPNVHTNLLSHTLQAFDRERTTTNNKQLSFPFNPKSSSDLENAHSDPIKANDCSDSEQPVPSTHYTHGSVLTNSHFHKTSSDSLQIQIQPLTTQKLELSKRAKSGHSIRSEVGSLHSTANTTDNDLFSSGLNGNSVHLTTKPANLPQVNSENVHNVMQGSSVKPKNVTSASISKESTLAAIYGPHNSIPQRAFTNAEDFRKVKKIFLSEKQSGTLKESGMEFPCAPPATPVPDVMKRYEYVPCMNDIRSQRAVKTKLQVMERESVKKKEKQKEAHAKLEKQQVKDREKLLKAQQRKEIYALNKIMTELEHKRFLEFCHAKGLNT